MMQENKNKEQEYSLLLSCHMLNYATRKHEK